VHDMIYHPTCLHIHVFILIMNHYQCGQVRAGDQVKWVNVYIC